MTERPAPGVWQTLRALPRPVVALLVGVAVNRTGSFVQLFLVLFLLDRGVSPAHAGLGLTAYGIGSVAGVLVGGAVTDAIGPRSTIVASMLSSGVLVGSFGFVHGFVALLPICALAGLCTQVFRPAAAALLAELTPSTRLVMANAIYRFGLNVGSAVGPLLGVFLATRSYTAVFLTDAVTSVLFAVTALVLLPPGRPRHREIAPGSYAVVARDRRYLLVIAAQFVTSFAEVQYQAVLPLEVRARGLSIAVFGALVSLNAVLVLALELPLTRYVQRAPLRLAIALGSGLIGWGMALFGLRIGLWILVAGTLVWTLGEMISAPSVFAYPALISPAQLRGRYYAALTASQTAGWALGPGVGAYVFQYHGTAVWSMCAVLGVLAAVGMLGGVLRPAEIAARAVPDPESAQQQPDAEADNDRAGDPV